MPLQSLWSCENEPPKSTWKSLFGDRTAADYVFQFLENSVEVFWHRTKVNLLIPFVYFWVHFWTVLKFSKRVAPRRVIFQSVQLSEIYNMMERTLGKTERLSYPLDRFGVQKQCFSFDSWFLCVQVLQKHQKRSKFAIFKRCYPLYFAWATLFETAKLEFGSRHCTFLFPCFGEDSSLRFLTLPRFGVYLDCQKRTIEFLRLRIPIRRWKNLKIH